MDAGQTRPRRAIGAPGAGLPPAPLGLCRGMWKRFLIASALIVALSGAATATIVLNEVSGVAAEVFSTTVHVPKGVVTPVYSGGPQTFLVLGSDRRALARDSLDR